VKNALSSDQDAGNNPVPDDDDQNADESNSGHEEASEQGSEQGADDNETEQKVIDDDSDEEQGADDADDPNAPCDASLGADTAVGGPDEDNGFAQSSTAVSDRIQTLLALCMCPESPLCSIPERVVSATGDMLRELQELLQQGVVDPMRHSLIAALGSVESVAPVEEVQLGVMETKRLEVQRLFKGYRNGICAMRSVAESTSADGVEIEEHIHRSALLKDPCVRYVYAATVLQRLQILGWDMGHPDESQIASSATEQVDETKVSSNNDGAVEVPSHIDEPQPQVQESIAVSMPEPVIPLFNDGVTAHGLIGHLICTSVVRRASLDLNFKYALHGMRLVHSQPHVLIDGKQLCEVKVYAHFPARLFVYLVSAVLLPRLGRPRHPGVATQYRWWTGFSPGVGHAPNMKSFTSVQVAKVPTEYYKHVCTNLTFKLANAKEGSVTLHSGRLLPRAYAATSDTSFSSNKTARNTAVVPAEVDQEAHFLQGTKAWSEKNMKSKRSLRPKRSESVSAILKRRRRQQKQQYREQVAQNRIEFEQRTQAFRRQEKKRIRKQRAQRALMEEAIANRDYFRDGKVPDVETLREFKAERPVTVKSLGFTVVERPE